MDALADAVMAGEDPATVADEYRLTRHEVLLACWYEATRGAYRTEWGSWAEEMYPALAAGVVDEVEDPPARGVT